MQCLLFSREDKIFIVEKWYETRSLAFIQRAFRQRDARYHGKNSPSRTSIERVVKHFQRSGTVADIRNTYLAQRGRDFSPEKVRRVKKVYARRQKVSLRRASHSTNVTRYFVAKILKKVLKKKPFKSAKTEKLTASQKLRRLTLCKKLISLPRLTTMLKNVWFTDESWFFSDGIAQKNKAFYWALSKDAVKPTIFQKYPIKVHVSVSGLIGPYFFHKDGSYITVNQYTYQDCIRWFICQLLYLSIFETNSARLY